MTGDRMLSGADEKNVIQAKILAFFSQPIFYEPKDVVADKIIQFRKLRRHMNLNLNVIKTRF